MRDKTAEENCSAKRDVITIDDGDPPSGQSLIEPVRSPEVVQLQQELAKQTERAEGAIRTAGEAVKEAEELRRSFEDRLSIEKRDSVAKAKAVWEQLVSTQLSEVKKRWEAKAAADKEKLDSLSAQLNEEKVRGQARDKQRIEISLMLENERRRGKYERERGDKRAEEDKKRFEELSTQLQAERARGKAKDAQEMVLKRENAQLKEEVAEMKMRLEDEIAKNTPKEEPIDNNEIPQDYQISASEIMRDAKEESIKEELNDENTGAPPQHSNPIALDSLGNLSAMPAFNELGVDFGIKDEENPDVISDIADDGIPIEDSLNRSFNDYETANRKMYPSDFMDSAMDFNDQIADDREETATEKDSFDDSPLNGMDGIDQSEKQNEMMEEQDKEKTDNHPNGTPKNGENNGRSSRRISTKRDSKFMDASDEDNEPSMENSRSESEKMNGRKKRRTSINGSTHSKSVVKKGKRSDTVMECPDCKFGTQSVGTWLAHVRHIHHTTPSLAGFALLCECGHEGFSTKHTFKCDVANFTVIRKKDGPIQRIDAKKATPQCILCEAYPKTAIGYVQHLHIHHKTTLKSNDIYLKCVCDFKLKSNDCRKHDKTCDGHHFTLHKRDEE